ncbi:MAG: hypothetical protein ACTSPO_15385 [Candidatus Heimdallarchaeaceae archaeon]
MPYYHILKNELKISLENIISDLEKIKETKTKLQSNSIAIDRFIRILNLGTQDLEYNTESTYENWQEINYKIREIRTYESLLAKLFLRFGNPRENLASINCFIDELCKEILLRSNLTVSEHPFIAVCGGNQYTNTSPINLISCRITDNYRLWNLGIIGHELGHYIYKELTSEPLVATGQPYDSEGNLDSLSVARNWLVELTSDIIGSMTVGPSLLFSHSLMPTFWTFFPQSEEDFLNNFRTHPPCEVRFMVHKCIMEELELPEIEQIENIFNYYTDLNRDSIEPEDHILLEKRRNEIEQMTQVTLDNIRDNIGMWKERINHFSKEDWGKSVEIAEGLDGGLEGIYTPSQILNGLIYAKQQITTAEEEATLLNKVLPLITNSRY